MPAIHQPIGPGFKINDFGRRVITAQTKTWMGLYYLAFSNGKPQRIVGALCNFYNPECFDLR